MLSEVFSIEVTFAAKDSKDSDEEDWEPVADSDEVAGVHEARAVVKESMAKTASLVLFISGFLFVYGKSATEPLYANYDFGESLGSPHAGSDLIESIQQELALITPTDVYKLTTLSRFPLQAFGL